MKMHRAFLSEFNSKIDQNSRLRPTEQNPKSLLHCYFSSTNLNVLKKQNQDYHQAQPQCFAVKMSGKCILNHFFCSSYPGDCSSNNSGDIQGCCDGGLAAAPCACSTGILSKGGSFYSFHHSTKSPSQQHSSEK